MLLGTCLENIFLWTRTISTPCTLGPGGVTAVSADNQSTPPRSAKLISYGVFCLGSFASSPDINTINIEEPYALYQRPQVVPQVTPQSCSILLGAQNLKLVNKSLFLIQQTLFLDFFSEPILCLSVISSF